jgi:hypothetical protein
MKTGILIQNHKVTLLDTDTELIDLKQLKGSTIVDVDDNADEAIVFTIEHSRPLEGLNRTR